MSKVHYPKELFPDVTAWTKVNYLINTAADKGLGWDNGEVLMVWENTNAKYTTSHRCYLPFFAYIVKQEWHNEEEAIAAAEKPAFNGTQLTKANGETVYGIPLSYRKTWHIGNKSYQLCYLDPWESDYVELQQVYMQNFKYYDVKGSCEIVPLSLILGNDYAVNRENIVKFFNKLQTITTSATLTIGSTILALLTDEDKKIATDKGWTLA